MTMPVLASTATDHATTARTAAMLAVARIVADRLSRGIALSRQALSSLMRAHVGGTDANGDWSLRDAYDALEAGQVLLALDPASPLMQWDAPDAAFRARDVVAQMLPTQTYRSERQVDLQQFSTPLGLAWFVACASQIRPTDLVLEPSAGTGMLAVHARHRGAKLILNERDPVRADLLALTLGQDVTRHDAEFIDDLLEDERRPDVVLINPPFARSESRGRDRHAGARHLESALRRLAPHGRCVAIMYPAFARDGTGAVGYRVVSEIVPPRWELTINGQPYARHGTSISVRVLVYDKGWRGEPQCHAVDGLAEAQALLSTVPARLSDPDIPPRDPVEPVALAAPAYPARRAGGLLSGLAAKKPLPPATKTRPADEPELLEYEILDEPPAAGEPIGIYLPWRATRLKIPGAARHANELVESVAMASVALPIPTYRPLLPRATVAALSDAQLETVIYAGQAFERDLPGRYRPNDAGTLLVEQADGAHYRMGFMVGDGGGVGKGRQIAACILDQWHRGQRRAVWISKTADLIEDARRDWTALGGLAIDVHSLDAFPFGAPITLDQGVIFFTYASLRSQRDDGASRLQQLLAWLGTDFEGVIAFDEAHEMSNAAGTETKFGKQKGSEQGLAGVRLQNLLPRARILYNSATGASDPANLCYAIRLPLWGNDAFESREAFMTAIEGGGVAAMEIVARDLKALGHYIARALSLRDVEYIPLEHRLTPDQIETYDAYAGAWAIVHRNLDKVLEATNIVDRMSGRTLNAQAKGAALSRFESAKQRFFNQLLIGMKLPTLIDAIEQDLAAGRHVLVQLVTTTEAMLERQLARLSAEGLESTEIEVCPREILIQYLETAFPTRQMRVFKGTDGEPRSELMVDAAGNAIHSQEAVRARDDLIEQLCSLPAIPGALDGLIGHFGTDILAEVTGRKRRVVTDASGAQRIERRSARSNVAELKAFMAASKSVLVFSDVGGTGVSAHADLNSASAHRQRVQYGLEMGWRAKNTIQGFYRSNRTNQASAPIMRTVTTDCPGERRFLSTIASRLESLGALTRGQRQTGGQNMFDPLDNLEGDYAQDALHQWYRLLHRGRLTSTSLEDFIDMTGLKLVDEDGMLRDTLPPIQRWLNRLLALRISTQNVIFDEFMALIQARVDAARERGTLDVGVETIAVDRIVPVEEQVLRRDVSGAETKLSRLELHRRKRPRPLAEVLSEKASLPDSRFLRNARSGRVALRVPSWSILDNEGRSIDVWELIRPTSCERLRQDRLDDSHWAECGEADFRSGWLAECEDVAARVEIESINIATGLLLPVWNRLPDDDVRVWRIADGQGNSLLGRIISPAGFETLAQAFGVSVAITLSPVELLSAARNQNGVAIPSLPGARLQRVHVNDEARFELKDFAPAKRPWLKSLGCYSEIIAYKTRLFLPPSRAIEILSGIEQAADHPARVAA
ncbi:strawberry notch-like NTP hydrolase domain-containing protein [Sphingomonas oryzagri]